MGESCLQTSLHCESNWKESTCQNTLRVVQNLLESASPCSCSWSSSEQLAALVEKMSVLAALVEKRGDLDDLIEKRGDLDDLVVKRSVLVALVEKRSLLAALVENRGAPAAGYEAA